MDLTHYIHNGFLTVVIDEDGDSFETYLGIVKIIENDIKPEKSKFQNNYWEESNGFFEFNGLTILLEYSNWTGTLLKVKNTFNDDEKEKFLSISKKIIQLHNQESIT